MAEQKEPKEPKEQPKKDQAKKEQQPKKAKGKGEGAGAEKKAAPAKEAGRPRANLKGGTRLRQKFEKEVRPVLMKELELDNPMAVPRLNKVVVNMGIGEATQNAKLIDPAAVESGRSPGRSR